ncbi:hypothetical protein YPPY34_1097 [Yersinia pestis PY-34]|nr:hypothetical protein YPPY03_1128 [Yersinia pestis PY-03]EIR07656.1 hypothetical protein YPPY05_1087 [Yersinia pestis PY-05]EIR81254.1 hypothetical protein YPPY34_1097 [Yersinia pestis PY-34]EIR95974.1 hypothetical protein YPPY45_1054 [Yersinia pestis PY-45]EIS35538.1 hypothetical protein YPPY56_1149 [Yersinia pestis PY-56]EIS48010.1 hypothetical protein YPPY58_1111 [Yersinia pestis PY-58]EIS60124.1 hypothetical protein YPPY61_1166 [Yersinia pestis PY-61]EIS70064.1 hypothetical protein YPP
MQGLLIQVAGMESRKPFVINRTSRIQPACSSNQLSKMITAEAASTLPLSRAR